jgi:hypothetical protein
VKNKPRFVLMGLILVGLFLGCNPSGTGGGGGATYTVTYNANGATGSVPTDNNAYRQGATVTVLGAASLAYSGFSFAGWTTSTIGPGASYAEGATLTMGAANVTLYCVWIPSNLNFLSSGRSITITGFSTAPTGSMTVPVGVTRIAELSFMGCTGLTSLTVPSSVTSMGYCAFDDCTGLTSVSIPDSITTIESCTFYYCSVLTSVTIPNSVTLIGSQAFENCLGLTSVTIPNSVTSLASEAFCNCSSLPSVTIPSSVTFIGGGAFANCYVLTTVFASPITPPTSAAAAYNLFSNSANLSAIKVPAGSVTAYKNAPYWSDYAALIVSQ